MFPAIVGGAHVGQANSHCVLERLKHDGVRVLFQDLGGASYRRLSWTIGPESPAVSAVAV
jgi:chemotaxis receptor (MCP) glutamine deamidase CheD